MGIGKFLGSISPLAGAVTGEGMFGKGMAKLAESGAGALLPMSFLAKAQRDKKMQAAEEAARSARSRGPRVGGPMANRSENVDEYRRGGKVKAKKMAKGGSTASKRADGCATKGKTKGRFV